MQDERSDGEGQQKIENGFEGAIVFGANLSPSLFSKALWILPLHPDWVNPGTVVWAGDKSTPPFPHHMLLLSPRTLATESIDRKPCRS